MDFEQTLEEHLRAAAGLRGILRDIECAATFCLQAIQAGHTVYLCGNGGSAADAQHIAAEFVGRFVTERRALPAMAFTTDTSILTSIGNDYGFAAVFRRQAEAFVREGDVLIGISTSGSSENVVAALAAAREKGAVTIALTGEKDGKMDELATICIKAPSGITARIQECHILIGHMICQYVDENFPNA